MNKPENKKQILMVPAEPYLKGELFNAGNKHLNRDGTLEPGIALKKALVEKGIELKTIDMGDVDQASWIIFCDTPPDNPYLKRCLAKKLNQKMILMVWEPPVVSKILYDRRYHVLFRYILTWNDDLVDNKKYFKFYWPQPEYNKKVEVVPFAERKMLTLIAGDKYSLEPGELYSERVRAINYFGKTIPHDFDFYGMGWGKRKIVLSKHPVKFLKLLQRYINYPGVRSYKGVVEDKIQTLSRYKFCICYENMKEIKGYITEKIFDCFKAGCVPVYLGAQNITDYIPENCFIDKNRYFSYDKLLNQLKSMEEDEYLLITNNIYNFMKRDRFGKFSIKGFIDNIFTILEIN